MQSESVIWWGKWQLPEKSENEVQQVIDDKLQKILQGTEEKKEDHGGGKSQNLLTAIWKTGGQGTPDRKSAASH